MLFGQGAGGLTHAGPATLPAERTEGGSKVPEPAAVLGEMPLPGAPLPPSAPSWKDVALASHASSTRGPAGGHAGSDAATLAAVGDRSATAGDTSALQQGPEKMPQQQEEGRGARGSSEGGGAAEDGEGTGSPGGPGSTEACKGDAHALGDAPGSPRHQAQDPTDGCQTESSTNAPADHHQRELESASGAVVSGAQGPDLLGGGEADAVPAGSNSVQAVVPEEATAGAPVAKETSSSTGGSRLSALAVAFEPSFPHAPATMAGVAPPGSTFPVPAGLIPLMPTGTLPAGGLPAGSMHAGGVPAGGMQSEGMLPMLMPMPAAPGANPTQPFMGPMMMFPGRFLPSAFGPGPPPHWPFPPQLLYRPDLMLPFPYPQTTDVTPPQGLSSMPQGQAQTPFLPYPYGVGLPFPPPNGPTQSITQPAPSVLPFPLGAPDGSATPAPMTTAPSMDAIARGAALGISGASSVGPAAAGDGFGDYGSTAESCPECNAAAGWQQHPAAPEADPVTLNPEDFPPLKSASGPEAKESGGAASDGAEAIQVGTQGEAMNVQASEFVPGKDWEASGQAAEKEDPKPASSGPGAGLTGWKAVLTAGMTPTEPDPLSASPKRTQAASGVSTAVMPAVMTAGSALPTALVANGVGGMPGMTMYPTLEYHAGLTMMYNHDCFMDMEGLSSETYVKPPRQRRLEVLEGHRGFQHTKRFVRKQRGYPSNQDSPAVRTRADDDLALSLLSKTSSESDRWQEPPPPLPPAGAPSCPEGEAELPKLQGSSSSAPASPGREGIGHEDGRGEGRVLEGAVGVDVVENVGSGNGTGEHTGGGPVAALPQVEVA